MSRLAGWTVIATIVIAISCVSVRADILVRRDGGLLDGKVISQNAKEIVFQADGTDVKDAQHLDHADITRVIITDEHGALLSDGAATQPATSTSSGQAARWNVPGEPVAPPVIHASGPTYYVIPLHGEVGVTVLAGALEKSLEDAVARKPTVVVLDIDSPGGLVEEAKQIIDVLHRYNKKLRMVAFTSQDLSAAAIFSLSVREIYVKSSSTIGAATSYMPDNLMLPPKIEEKMQSAWRAVARNSAEEGRHEPLLAEAMIDNDLELHLETVGGKTMVKEGHGDRVLCRKGKILTLSSHEAVECGLAAGNADDLGELGTALKLANWKEIKGLGTLLAESLPKRAEAYKIDMEKIHVRFQQDIAAAVNSDPSQSVTTVTRLAPAPVPRPIGPHFPGHHVTMHSGSSQQTITVTRTHSPARWKADSLACVVSLQQSEADIKDAIALDTAYGRTSEVEMLKDALAKISAIRATVYDDRNKHGQGQVVAANNPAPATSSNPGVNPTPGPVNPTPGPVNPAPRPGNVLPPGWVRTEEIGGKGGIPYTTRSSHGTPVLGFRCVPGSRDGKQIIRRLNPTAVKIPGAPIPDINQVMAKDGYVVSGLIVDSDETNVVAVRIIFAGYKDGHIVKDDTYTSDWLGTPDKNPTHTIAGNGETVLGTCGRRSMNLDAIGLLVRVPDNGK